MTDAPRSPRDTAWLVAAALSALLPLVVLRRDFAKLYWFGDDWYVLDSLDRSESLLSWLFTPFAESFLPIFKAAWGSLVLASGGSYLALITAIWLAHALNVYLLGRVLRTMGVGMFATLAGQLVLALTPVNIETLGWSVQLAPHLAMAFLLAALALSLRVPIEEDPHPARRTVLIALLCLGSALAYNRGVLTGIAMAVPAMLSWRELWPRFTRPRVARALACLAPAVAVVAIMLVLTQGPHRQVAEIGRTHLAEMLRFGAAHFGGNPLRGLLGYEMMDAAPMLVISCAKLLVIGAGLAVASPMQRVALLALLLFDLGNAALLGIGRFHTGLPAAYSSRYQYGALVALLPFLCVLLDRLVAQWRSAAPPAMRWVGAAALVAFGFVVARDWPRTIDAWSGWRGTAVRQATASQDPAAPLPYMPWMSTARARELEQKYGLH